MDEGDPRGGAPHVLLPGRLFIGPCHGDTVGEAVGGADSLPRPPSRLSAMASVAPDFSPLRFCEIIPARVLPGREICLTPPWPAAVV
jgi:hypothetical protein